MRLLRHSSPAQGRRTHRRRRCDRLGEIYVSAGLHRQTRQTRTSQPERDGSLPLDAIHAESEQNSSPSTSTGRSAQKFLRMAEEERQCGANRNVWSIKELLVDGLIGIEHRKLRPCLATNASLFIELLQTGVSVESHFSRICPAITRPLASALIPRPAALGVLLRPFGRPAGFGFQKIFPAKNAKKIFRTFRKRHAFGTWERGASRRFAQECPE